MAKNQKSYTPEFKQQILDLYNTGGYSYPQLERKYGIPCSLKRVQHHMKAQELRSKVVKKYNHHANKGAVPDGKENILNRDFKAVTINQKWCTDIT